ncbi:MAG: hypothetical protein JWM31_3211 [Solirubrobacterales bacterium]|nr:hypothetical protein [Solirubrobacterales bacterium]
MAAIHTPLQVSEAVQALAACGGSPKDAAKLISFTIGESTLRRWRDETHAQSYADQLDRYQREVEADNVVNLRRLALRATEVEAELLEKLVDCNDVPSGLRAAPDVKAKSIDRLLSLTGWTPVSLPGDGDLRSLLEGMAAAGHIRLSVSLDAVTPPCA